MFLKRVVKSNTLGSVKKVSSQRQLKDREEGCGGFRVTVKEKTHQRRSNRSNADDMLVKFEIFVCQSTCVPHLAMPGALSPELQLPRFRPLPHTMSAVGGYISRVGFRIQAVPAGPVFLS